MWPGLLAPIHLLPGQFVTGRKVLREELYPHPRRKRPAETTVWRWLETLATMRNVRIESTTSHSLVTVVKWPIYQGSTEPVDFPIADSAQRTRNQRATDAQPVRTEESNTREEIKSLPTTREAGKSPGAMPRAFGAFRRLMGIDSVGCDDKLARYVQGSLAGSQILIGGGPVDPWELVARACSDGVERGNKPNSIGGGVSLVRAIVERCIRDGRWPGDFEAKEKTNGNSIEQRRSRQAEREYADVPDAARL